MSDPQRQRKSPDGGPRTKIGRGEEYKKYIFAGDRTSWTGNHGAITVPKRVEDGGTVGYGGFGAFGFMSWICPTSSIRSLAVIRSTNSTPLHYPFHTCYPLIAEHTSALQNIVVALHEALDGLPGVYHTPYVLDVKNRRSENHGFFRGRRRPPMLPIRFLLRRGRLARTIRNAGLAPVPRILRLLPFPGSVRPPGFDLFESHGPKGVPGSSPHDGDINKYETWWRARRKTCSLNLTAT